MSSRRCGLWVRILVWVIGSSRSSIRVRSFGSIIGWLCFLRRVWVWNFDLAWDHVRSYHPQGQLLNAIGDANGVDFLKAVQEGIFPRVLNLVSRHFVPIVTPPIHVTVGHTGPFVSFQ